MCAHSMIHVFTLNNASLRDYLLKYMWVPSASAAAFGLILDKLDLPPIDFCSIQFTNGILHVRIGRKLHNSTQLEQRYTKIYV